VLTYETSAGRPLGSFDGCGDTDDLFFDAARKRLYLSCGAGFVDVFEQQDSGGLTRSAHVATAPGARTSLFVPALGRLYVAVPRREDRPAEIRGYAVR
jgi:hypothetical protein